MGRRDQDDWGVPEEAARWFCRLNGPDAERHHANFEAWLAESASHRHEFYLVSLIDMQMDALRRRAGELRLGEPPDSDRRVISFRPRDSHRTQRVAEPVPRPGTLARRAERLPSAVWLAATVAALLFGLLLTYGVFGAATVYETRMGERRTVRLEDGTIVQLNTRSRLTVSFTPQMRSLELIDGEVLIDVAHESRPFQVRVGLAVIQDIGTQFSIRRRGQDADVVVQEGQVNVAIAPRATRGGTLWRPLASLHAGEAATISTKLDAREPEVRELSTTELNEGLAWTRGHIAFAGQRLDEIVAEFNRYNVRKIQIADPSVAELRLGGQFDASDPEGFASTVAAIYGLRMEMPADSDGPIRLVGVAQ